jgi:predicted dehydrogenase
MDVPVAGQVGLLIIGCGSRGMGYADFVARNPGLAKLVGIAEPREGPRHRLVREHGIPPANVYSDWRELARRERFAEAAIIATQDSMHVEPVEALAARGYHLLLEKPMASDEEGCRRIIEAVGAKGVLLSVAHVLRYTPYTRKLKEILASGAIGDIVSIQHLEPVGYWHQAHSYVRGNWRKESESSSMLLAKSCHDLDWIRYIMGVRCVAVSSFGGLKHFRKEEKPAGAGGRCLECAIEPRCPYSARKIYLGRLEKGQVQWPVDVITEEVSREGVLAALRDGPYGRCVYECDNDVVDHQVVNLLFEGGRTATFTMTAFNEYQDRQTHIFGTRGEIYGDGSTLLLFDFLTDSRKVVRVEASDFTLVGGHAGGDDGLTAGFLAAVAGGGRSEILSGPLESLDSHLMVFRAEKARKQNTVEFLP